VFLNRFVTGTTAGIHLDIAALTDRPKPGHPRGGNPNAAPAIYAILKMRFRIVLQLFGRDAFVSKLGRLFDIAHFCQNGLI
jgi:hypothetical protein